MDREKISKEMAYLLRHDPKGMDVSDEGFVDLGELMLQLRKRWPNLRVEDIKRVAENDQKGRYEINGKRIRARYGHSIPVSLSLNETSESKLYHGTTQEAAEKIMQNGLSPMGRGKVHLSKTVDNALEVGKRRTSDPVILEIDVKGAKSAGIRVEKASESVYVADGIPPEYISIKKN